MYNLFCTHRVVELETVGSHCKFRSPVTLPVVQLKPLALLLGSTAYNVCVSGLPPVSPSKTTCLLRFPAGGVDKKVGFLSNLKEVKQLRKVEMTSCVNLSPSLLATICGGICSSNSMEEVVVTTLVSSLFLCLTTPCKLLSSVSNLPLKTIYIRFAALNRRQPLPLTWRNPHDAVQLAVLFIQFFIAVCSSDLYSFVIFVVC